MIHLISRGLRGFASALVLAPLHLVALDNPTNAGLPADGKTLAVAEAKQESNLDRIWKLPTLYHDDTNPFVEEVKLKVMYHGQYHWLKSEQGNENSWEDRLAWYGADLRFLERTVLVRLLAGAPDGFDEAYECLVEAYGRWTPTPEFTLTVGRQKPQLAYYDWGQSAVHQSTFERSQIFCQLGVSRVPGVVAEYHKDKWSFLGGVYSNEVDSEFGKFDGGASFSAGGGYTLKQFKGIETTTFHLDYLHSEIQAEDTSLNRYKNLLTATVWLNDTRYSLVAEGFSGAGKSADVMGFYLLGMYDIILAKLQLVARYSFAEGDGLDSVVATGRYERRAPELTGKGRGERYNAVYVGTQYFIRGDDLKLMAGAEYAHLDGGGNGGDYSGWTFLTGIRLNF